MNPKMRKAEMTKAFMGLSHTNRDYIMAITRALTFAQNTVKPEPACEKCKRVHTACDSQGCSHHVPKTS